MVAVTTKVCSHCQLPKSTTEFNKRRNMKDGLQRQCKLCQRAGSRSVYKNNPMPYKHRAAKRRDKVRAQLNRVLLEMKMMSGCRLCPERAFCVLDFHHVVKGVPVTRMVSKGYAAFLREVNKCIVVCANCHRKVHAGALSAGSEKMCKLTMNELRKMIDALEAHDDLEKVA